MTAAPFVAASGGITAPEVEPTKAVRVGLVSGRSGYSLSFAGLVRGCLPIYRLSDDSLGGRAKADGSIPPLGGLNDGQKRGSVLNL